MQYGIYYDELPMFYSLTSLEFIYTIGVTVPETSKLVMWLQFLKLCPKLQNITIQVGLAIAYYFFPFFLISNSMYYFKKKICQFVYRIVRLEISLTYLTNI
jgi:hypothetical protein